MKRLVPLALLLAIGVAHADVDRNYWRSPSLGLEVAFPADWAVSEQTSYPTLLASANDFALGGRMTLAYDTLGVAERVRDAAERNRQALIKLGWKAKETSLHPTGAVIFEAESADRKRLVRQAYRVLEDPEMVFVVTLSASPEAMQRYRRAFDDTLRGLTQRPRASAPEQP